MINICDDIVSSCRYLALILKDYHVSISRTDLSLIILLYNNIISLAAAVYNRRINERVKCKNVTADI